MCLSVVCACGDLTEIQIAIWSPDETQYTAQSSVRSWQTLHIRIDLIKQYYRLRARRARSDIYLYLYLCVLRVDRGCRDGKATRGSSYSPAPKSCRARRVAEGAQRGNVDSTSTRSPLLPLVRSFTSPGDFRRIRQPASQRASWPPRLLSLFHARLDSA